MNKKSSKQLAEEMTRECAKKLAEYYKANGGFDSLDEFESLINESIPLEHLFECVEALRKSAPFCDSDMCNSDGHYLDCSVRQKFDALTALDKFMNERR